MSDRWVDVSHEALIRGWPRLRRWIEEGRAGLRVHRRLTEAALEWDKMGRDNSALHRGARLSQATEWRQGKEASLNDLERAFLDASAALERHEADARERLRRRVIGGLSIALAIFVVLAVLAFLQWRQADQRGQIALARQLAAQADLLRDQPEMLSRRLALATEGMQRLHAAGAHSLEVDATLRRELALSPRHVAASRSRCRGRSRRTAQPGRPICDRWKQRRKCRVGLEIATGKELVRIESMGRELTVTGLGQKPVRIQIEGQGGRDEIVGWSREGKVLATMNRDGFVDVVQVSEVANGRELLRLDLRGSNSYALSDDGRYFAASTSIYDDATRTYSEAITRVWDVKTRRDLPGSVPGGIHGFSEDATFLATSRGLWEVADGLKERLAWQKRTAGTAISPESGYVAVDPAGAGGIEVWSTATREKTASAEVGGSPLALTPVGSS